MLIGEDVGYFGGVYRCTDGLQRKYGESRVIDASIPEGGIVGAVVGVVSGTAGREGGIDFGSGHGARGAASGTPGAFLDRAVGLREKIGAEASDGETVMLVVAVDGSTRRVPRSGDARVC